MSEGHFHRFCLAAALSVAAVALGWPAQAQTANDWKSCTGNTIGREIEGCTKILRIPTLSQSNKAIAYNNRGYVHMHKGEYDRAIQDLDEAIRQNPKLAAGYSGRGTAYYKKGDFDRALQDFDEALRLSPAQAAFFRMRALTFAAKGNEDRAIQDYNEAIRLDPKDSVSFQERGMSYSIKREYDRAITDYEEAIRLNPKNTNAYIVRGVAYGFKGDCDRALRDFDEALRLNPAESAVHGDRAFCYNVKGEYDRAIAEASEAIRGDPQNGAAYSHRAFAYNAKGDYGRALIEAEDAIRFNPRYSRAYANRGFAYEKKGDPEKALADYRKALSLNDALKDAQEGIRRLEQPAAVANIAPPQTAAKPAPAASAPVAATPVVPAPVAAAPKAADPGRRVALVIGNAAYKSVAPLANPRRDAEAVSGALRDVGFQVVRVESDIGRDKLVDALRAFAREAESADWAVVYYAGHGIEMGGINYLIPVDARLEVDRDVEFEAVPLDRVMSAVEGARKLRLVLLDACRDNPFAAKMRRTIATRSVGRGLASVEPATGTLVVYGAKHGETALDGDGVNSPFAAALVKQIKVPGLEVRRLFDYVRDDVMEATNNRQQPFSYGSVPGRQDFFFVSSR